MRKAEAELVNLDEFGDCRVWRSHRFIGDTAQNIQELGGRHEL